MKLTLLFLCTLFVGTSAQAAGSGDDIIVTGTKQTCSSSCGGNSYFHFDQPVELPNSSNYQRLSEFGQDSGGSPGELDEQSKKACAEAVARQIDASQGVTTNLVRVQSGAYNLFDGNGAVGVIFVQPNGFFDGLLERNHSGQDSQTTTTGECYRILAF